MAFYIITGKLRSGKSLVATFRMKQRLLSGARVATNFDLNVEHLLPVTVQKIDLTRLPDLPAVEDLQALGQGSTEFAEESKFGLIVLDEGSGNFNARDWADKSRQSMLDWLKHSGKLRWDVYIIIQSINTIDKQIRDSFAENLVICKRMDKLAIPFISSFTSLLGLNIKMPKIHVGIVRYGLDARAPIVDRWFYRGIDLYKAYNTEQVFEKTPHLLFIATYRLLLLKDIQ
jgi:Zonular occludens toxin (Zot)